ncbi:MAG: beta-ketoacyl synthase, partial [Cyanobacteria bacterium J06553_1]
MQTLQQECNIFLEIGSKPILLGMGRSNITDETKTNLWLPSLRPRKKDWQQILQSLGSLYVRGIELNWQQVAQGLEPQKVSLPTYPFQRQSYWLTKTASSSKIEVYLPSDQQTSSTDFYQVTWQADPGQLSPSVVTEPWLIFTGASSLGEKLEASLTNQQQDCLVVRDRHLTPDSLAQILQQRQFGKILYLAGTNNAGGTIAKIEQYQQQHCTNVLSLLQTLTANSLRIPVWLATRGSQSIDPDAKDLEDMAIAASSLWGLGTAIAVEHPELWGGMIDLEENSDRDAEYLLQIISQDRLEDRVAVRANKFYVPRLDKADFSRS